MQVLRNKFQNPSVKRISKLSSDEEILNNNSSIYRDTLKSCGFPEKPVFIQEIPLLLSLLLSLLFLYLNLVKMCKIDIRLKH